MDPSAALLDEPGKWYHDKLGRKLYITDGSPPKVLTAPAVRELISFEGSQRSPVSNIRFDGLTFAHTTHTFMEPYMVRGHRSTLSLKNGTTAPRTL